MKITNIIKIWAVLCSTAWTCLLPEERQAERERYLYGAPRHRPAFRSAVTKDEDPTPDFPIGTGDRFHGGKTVPTGIGIDPHGFDSILNMDEVKSGLRGLANAYDDVDFFTAPHQTYEKRFVYGVSVGKPRVYLEAGIHARERGGPDMVLYFIADLLRARETHAGLHYGNRSFTHAQVLTALSAGAVVVPVVNPDGVAYDARTNGCWRKNRNPKSATPGDEWSVGVDLNRNFDFLWDYKKDFNPDADIADAASDDPASEIFHGLGPLSEPETKNVAWVMRSFEHLSWFLDLHSVSGDVLYAWGDDDTQTTDPAQNFLNATYDGLRGFLGVDPANSTYGEYMEASDLSAQEHIATLMCTAMTSAAPSVPFQALRTSAFYPTSGGSNDFALSGYYGRRCGANRIQGLGMEFGLPVLEEYCPFYPTGDLYRTSLRQVAVGLMELMLFAAGEAGEPKKWHCE